MSAGTRSGRTALVIAAVAGLLLFVWLELLTDAWAGQRVHSGNYGELKPIQVMSCAEIGLYASLLLLLPAALAVAAWARSADWSLGLLDFLERGWRPVVFAAALMAGILATGVSHLVLQRTPISDDEWAYLFHARVMAGGHLSAESPPGRSFYNNVFLINNGRWYSQYPPGNPATLAVGVLIGNPWLVPAVLAACIVLLLAGIAQELFGPVAAASTAVLAAASPFLVAVSGTLLAHTPCLAFLALFLWAGLKATRPDGSRHWVWLAAVAYGAAVLTRPTSALFVGIPLHVLIWQRSRRLPDRWVRWGLYAGIGVVLLALQLGANWAAGGRALQSGYVSYWLPREGFRSPFAFGRFPWGIHHTPAAAFGNSWHNLLRLNAWLLGWPLSLLLPVAVVVKERQRRMEVLCLLASGVVSFGLYFLYFWPGIPDVGPVLYSETMLAWLPLAGAAVAVGSKEWRRWALGLVACSMVLAGAFFHRLQIAPLRATAAAAGAPQRTVQEQAPEERSLVFCPYYLSPGHQQSWCAGRPNPWPDLRDQALFVLDHGSQYNRAFWQQLHPGRRPYKLLFDAETGLSLQALDPDSEQGW
jgi:hypothetical protein